ncbi:MAG TPA: SCO family protein [Candidatus Binataceae bacterium]|nr:SCO family protein [Candidatus Binataceae bacterium]
MHSKQFATKRNFDSVRVQKRSKSGLLAVVALTLVTVVGCRSQSGAYNATNNANCLPDLNLVDQTGKNVNLSSLKGKPVLVDFIYTSCPGPCLTLTGRMNAIAKQLGPALGTQFTLVSVSIDPEHDGPQQMKQYADAHGVNQPGWLFLTGRPNDVDALLSAFKLRREREDDGSVSHVVGVFLLDSHGRELREYNGEIVKPDEVAVDLRKALSAS